MSERKSWSERNHYSRDDFEDDAKDANGEWIGAAFLLGAIALALIALAFVI